MFVMCVRDIKADVFGNPFFVSAIGMAERQFGDEVNRAAHDNLLYLHPEDFELYQLGTFEPRSATFEILAKPSQVAVGSSVAKKVPLNGNQKE